jgi:hypothetical protein
VVLGRIVGGVADGDFHAEPHPNECRWCDFDSVCDIGRRRIAERKGEDKRCVTFAEMRAVE